MNLWNSIVFFTLSLCPSLFLIWGTYMDLGTYSNTFSLCYFTTFISISHLSTVYLCFLFLYSLNYPLMSLLFNSFIFLICRSTFLTSLSLFILISLVSLFMSSMYLSSLYVHRLTIFFRRTVKHGWLESVKYMSEHCQLDKRGVLGQYSKTFVCRNNHQSWRN